MSRLKLSEIPINKEYVIKKINLDESIKRRILDIGVIEGSKVKKVLVSPSKDPKAFLIKGALIALRDVDSKNIMVELYE